MSEIRTHPVTQEYEAGFQRTFGDGNRESGHWVWDAEAGQLVPLNADWRPPDRRVPVVGDSHYDGLRSPVDGADISSRTKHRQYMKDHNLTTIDDFSETWRRAEQDRANVEVRDRAARRDAIGRAWYEQEQRARHAKR